MAKINNSRSSIHNFRETITLINKNNRLLQSTCCYLMSLNNCPSCFQRKAKSQRSWEEGRETDEQTPRAWCWIWMKMKGQKKMPDTDWLHSSAGPVATYPALITSSLWSTGCCIWSFSTELKLPVSLVPLKIKGVRKGWAVMLPNSWVLSGGGTFPNGIIFITVSVSIPVFLPFH